MRFGTWLVIFLPALVALGVLVVRLAGALRAEAPDSDGVGVGLRRRSTPAVPAAVRISAISTSVITIQKGGGSPPGTRPLPPVRAVAARPERPERVQLRTGGAAWWAASPQAARGAETSRINSMVPR